MGVRRSAQSFGQQQCNGAAKAVAANYNALAGVKPSKITEYEILHGPKRLIKPEMRFTNTLNKGDLMGIRITQDVGAASRATHSDENNLIVMTDECLSIRTRLNIVKK